MKIYLVQNTSGSFEDTWERIDKVFDSRAKAQQYVETILNRIYDLNQLRDKIHHEEFNEADIAYEKGLVQFEVDFPDSHYDSWDGNRFQIIERDVE